MARLIIFMLIFSFVVPAIADKLVPPGPNAGGAPARALPLIGALGGTYLAQWIFSPGMVAEVGGMAVGAIAGVVIVRLFFAGN